MDETARPWRSVLYIPASSPRALEKARGLDADAIIFDLEDAVAPAEKPAARALLAGILAEGGYGGRARLVRVNGLDTPWGREDVAALAGLEPDGILLPKVQGSDELDALAALAPGRRLWAMLETPRGVLAAAPVAAHPALAGVVMGTNDLAKEIGCRVGPGRTALVPALAHCLMAARAFGRVAIDGVWNALRDPVGLAAECAEGRMLGFDGKSLVHPDQIAAANAAFAPSAGEIALARRQIAAHAEAAARGQGVAVLDGRIVENLHVAAARRLLARAAAIGAGEEGA
ncbi:MAG: CoA ester lyase [Rhodobacteraceae bacterium]|nr:CoA ester lyase [Paracoccaceae bacterium]